MYLTLNYNNPYILNFLASNNLSPLCKAYNGKMEGRF